MKKRERVTTDRAVLPTRLYRSIDQSWQVREWSSFSYYSRITDYSNKKAIRKAKSAVNGRLPQSDVDHVSIDMRELIRPHNLLWPSDALYTGQFRQLSGVFRPHLPQETPFLEYLSPAVESHFGSFAQDAYDAFTEQMPQEISLPNFLYEAKEVGDLVKDLPVLLYRLNADLTTKTASEIWLQYNFGLAPLFDDLNTIFSLAKTIQSRLDYLKSIRRKLVRLGHSEDLLPSNYFTKWEGSAFQSNSYSSGTDINRTDFYCVKQEVKYTAGAWLFHDLSGLDDWDTFLRAFLAATGFGQPLTAIWNAIPFSFLIDWVYDFSSFLKVRGARPFTGQWEVSGFNHSILEKATFEVEQTFSLRSPLYLGKCYLKRYRRRRHLPEPLNYFQWPLSAKKLSLLAALLRQVD